MLGCARRAQTNLAGKDRILHAEKAVQRFIELRSQDRIYAQLIAELEAEITIRNVKDLSTAQLFVLGSAGILPAGSGSIPAPGPSGHATPASRGLVRASRPHLPIRVQPGPTKNEFGKEKVKRW